MFPRRMAGLVAISYWEGKEAGIQGGASILIYSALTVHSNCLNLVRGVGRYMDTILEPKGPKGSGTLAVGLTI